MLRRRVRSRRLEARLATTWSREAGVELRLHSWFSQRDRRGRRASRASSARPRRAARRSSATSSIDATGDLDVAAAAGAPHIEGTYIVTTVFRLGSVDTDAAERFEHEEPEAFAAIDSEAKRIIGGSLGLLVAEDAAARRRVVQLPAHDRLRRPEGRGPDARRVRGPRAHRTRWSITCAPTCRASRTAIVVDVAPQTRRAPDAPARRRVRRDQGRRDASARTSPTRVARGRDYYTPYRSLLPKERRRACSSPAATTRRPRRRRRCRARSRPAWRWARRPASRPRWRSTRGVPLRDVDVGAICSAGCARRAPIRATSRADRRRRRSRAACENAA